ncbi:MAG TPA: iron transporter [Planctomycetaceae bacterium]|nr:iron transporter [Planctomycetaceae bacterium]
MTTTLDQLRPGQSGEIARVEGCDGISCRLREMGFVPGEVVRFLTAAPLGDPLNCIIQGSRVALRGREARRISLVSPVPVDAPALAASGKLQGLSEKHPTVDPIAV